MILMHDRPSRRSRVLWTLAVLAVVIALGVAQAVGTLRGSTNALADARHDAATRVTPKIFLAGTPVELAAPVEGQSPTERVRADATVTLHVSSGGEPVPRARVYRCNVPARALLESDDFLGKTDPDGKVEIVASAEDSLLVYKEEYAPRRGRLNTFRAMNGTFSVVLGRTYEATIALTMRGGGRPAGVEVAISRATVDMSLTSIRASVGIGDRCVHLQTTDASGIARFTSLPAGEYQVQILSTDVASLSYGLLQVPGPALQLPVEYVYAAAVRVPVGVLQHHLVVEGSYVPNETRKKCAAIQAQLSERFPGSITLTNVPGAHVGDEGVGLFGHQCARLRLFTREGGWSWHDIRLTPAGLVDAVQPVEIPRPDTHYRSSEIMVAITTASGEEVAGVPFRARLKNPHRLGDHATTWIHSSASSLVDPGEYIVIPQPPVIRAMLGVMTVEAKPGECAVLARVIPVPVEKYMLSVTAAGQPLARASIRFIRRKQYVGQSRMVDVGDAPVWLAREPDSAFEVGAWGFRSVVVSPELYANAEQIVVNLDD